MRYTDYLRVEGTASLVLGGVLAFVAFPGLAVSYAGAWSAPLFVLAFAGIASAWKRTPDPHRWFTERPLATADPEPGPVLGEPALRRRLWGETLAWILIGLVTVLVLESSGLLWFALGLVSAAYGAVQFGPSRSRALAEERARGGHLYLRERPALGTPRLRLRSKTP